MIPIHVSIILCSFYISATALFLCFLKDFKLRALRFGRWLLTIGVVLHWGMLITYFKHTGIFFPTNTPQSHLVITGFLASACLFLSARRSALLVIVLLLPIIVLDFVFLYWSSGAEPSLAIPSPWIWTHVLLMLLGEAFFCFSAVASVVYLITETKLRHRSISQLFARLPSLPAFDLFLSELLWAGFGFLTIGLIMGVVFAHQFWVGGWWLDPKVLFCTMSWAWYGLVLILRLVSKRFLGRNTAVLSIIGFLGMIFLSMGLHYVFPTQHETFEQTTEPK